MNKPSENKSFQEKLIDRMQEKETEELIAIWQENNRDAWTEEAFKAIELVIIERLGKLPERKKPESEDEDQNKLPGLEYPTDRKLFWIADLSNSLSWIILAVGIIYALAKLLQYFFVQASPIYPASAGVWNGFMAILSQVDSIVYAGFTFLVLQATTEVIYLLMDIREMIQPETVDKMSSPEITSK